MLILGQPAYSVIICSLAMFHSARNSFWPPLRFLFSNGLSVSCILSTFCYWANVAIHFSRFDVSIITPF